MTKTALSLSSRRGRCGESPFGYLDIRHSNFIIPQVL
jgi:hypothetical protein